MNWLVKPFSMAFFAWVFIHQAFAAWIDPETAKNYTAGLSSSPRPCTAMVFVWSYLTDGDPAYTLVQVAVNDSSCGRVCAHRDVLCGWPMWWSRRKCSSRPLSCSSSSLGGGIPHRKGLLKSHGQEWFEERFLPKFHPVTVGRCSRRWS